MSRARIARIVEPLGFTAHEEPGFVGWHRRTADGRAQLLHCFFWSSAKCEDGGPRAYIVFAPATDAPALPGEDGYYRVEDERLTVVTVDSDGVRRPWSDVAAEIESIIVPIMEATEDESVALCERARETNAL